jgi:thioredoxin-like negative regulator of GroEL
MKKVFVPDYSEDAPGRQCRSKSEPSDLQIADSELAQSANALGRIANALERIAYLLEKLELFANDEAALEVTDEKSYQ